MQRDEVTCAQVWALWVRLILGRVSLVPQTQTWQREQVQGEQGNIPYLFMSPGRKQGLCTAGAQSGGGGSADPPRF